MPTLQSPAKLNLFLEVVGKRPDGFHDIDSVFLEIDLADTLHAEPADGGTVSLTCDRPDLPVDCRNLVVKAAERLRRECGVREGIAFDLQKRIPAGAGLGGGSSNAAGALRLANTVWKTGLSDAELAVIAADVGSDVPFFLHGGLCLCRGRGEIIARLPDLPAGIGLGLALTGIFSDTASAYRGLALPAPGRARKADEFIRAAESGDIEGMAAAAFNRFEKTVFAAHPPLADHHARLERYLRRPVRMSGSGSGLWFFGCEDEPKQGASPRIFYTKAKQRNCI